MKKMICTIFSVIIMISWLGCGQDTESKKTQEEKDKIEKIGNASSVIGYDGEKIKKDLRGLEDLKKKQDQQVEEIPE